MQTIKEVCEKIWHLEDTLKLFEREVAGVCIWPLVRMKVYYRICQAIGVFTTPHSEKLSVRNGLRAAGNVVRSPLTSPFRKKEKKKFLVFDHPRKVQVDGEYVDIYTQSLLATLPPDDTEVFENWYQGFHWTDKHARRTYLDTLSIGSALSSLFPLTFSKEDNAFTAELEQSLFREFKVAVPLRSLFVAEVKHHLYSVSYYKKLLRSRQPEKVFLVVSYGHYKRALICAAKELGIETAELQHGTFSPYHLGYNFPNLQSGAVRCFPDRFLSFGDYWNRLAALPIPEDHIQTHGFAHFHRQVAKVKNSEKEPGTILVISQGVIGKELSTVVRNLAERLSGHRILCKLHPGEYDLWKSDYPDLVEAARLSNVEVIDNSRVDLYTLFARCEFLVGVFSTAIYEGLALGCITFAVDLPGVEYMDYLVEKNMIFKVKDAAAIAERINSPVTLTPFTTDFIFADPTAAGPTSSPDLSR